jgi:hypothetical protein
MAIEQSLPDAHRTLNALAHQGYTPQTAIADIVDNSISAKASKISVNFKLQVDDSTLVYIGDNGIGMSLETLRRAMQIGSAAGLANSTLSVYGMGMKAASMSFSRKFTVITRDAEGKAHHASWDLGDQHENPWTIDIGEATTKHKKILDLFTDGKSGTLVVWDNADFKEVLGNRKGTKKFATNSAVAEDVKTYLGMAFHRFIEGNVDGYRTLEIKFNDELLTPWNPVAEEFLSDDWKPVNDSFSIDIEIDGKSTSIPYSITTYLLKNKEEADPAVFERSKVGMKTQGIYPYRENRLLQEPTWLNVLSFHPDWNSLRVVLELDPRLDGVTRTDMKKSGLSLPAEMWENLRDKLEYYSKNQRAQLKSRKAATRSRTDTKDMHKSSSTVINFALPDIEKVQAQVIDSNTLQVETQFGSSITELSQIDISMTSRDSRIEPVEDLQGGVLFEPVLRGSEQVILLNKSHPFYQKIYMALYQDPLAIRGMDFLLYSLAQSEWLTRTDRIKEQFHQMRQQMSNILRSFVVEMDDPRGFDDEGDDN